MYNESAHRFREALGSHLVIDDWQAIDCVLGVMAAHYFTGDPIWLRVIGVSGSGKSELLSAAKDHPDCDKIETLTPGSVRRGYVPKNGAQLATMLERINGKLVITKEMAGMLTANKETRNETFGLLRSVYDGEIVSDYGSDQGHIEQRTRFDWIAASTPFIDQQRNLESLLGSRFVDIRWSAPADTSALYKLARDNDYSMLEIRSELAIWMHKYLDFSRKHADCDNDHEADKLYGDSIVKLIVPARSHVVRDSLHEVVDIPCLSETGTRFVKFYSRFINGLHVLGVEDVKPYLLRVAFDSMPTIRAKMVCAILAGNKTQGGIAEYTNLSEGKVSREIEDMKMLGADLQGLCDMFEQHVKGSASDRTCGTEK